MTTKRVFSIFLWVAALVAAAFIGEPLLFAQNNSNIAQSPARRSVQPVNRDVAKEAERRYKLGVQQGLASRYAEAAESFRQAIALNPQYPDAHFGLGHAFFDLGRWSAAVEELRTAVRLNPRDADAHHMMGLAYCKQGDYTRGVQSLQQAVQLKPDWARAHYDLGNAFFKLGKFPGAAGHYAKVIALKPNEPEAYNDLGAAYGEIGRYGDAFSALMKAVKMRPLFAAAHNNLGLIHYRQGRHAQAADAFRVAQRYAPEEPAILSNLELTRNNTNPGNARQGTWIVRTALDAEPTQSEPLRTLIASNGQVSVPFENARLNLDQPAPTTRLPINPAKTSDVPPVRTPTPVPVATTTTAAAANITAAAATPPASVNSAEPVPPTSIYRVGAGDMLDIRVLSQPSNSSTLYTILAGGLLEYPVADEPLMVAGLTTDEVDARITAELERRGVVTNPEVIVSVREYASHVVIISGLVGDPGNKVLRREAIPLYVVLADAQPTTEAGQVEITSHRTGQRSVVSLVDQAAMNTLIYPGDVLKVEARPAQFYYIGGNVTNPGQKQFHPSLTLTQAILASGGSIQKAEVGVTREAEDGRLKTVKHNLRDITSGKLPDPAVKAGDRIEVMK